jgi:hypothetical protein
MSIDPDVLLMLGHEIVVGRVYSELGQKRWIPGAFDAAEWPQRYIFKKIPTSGQLGLVTFW